MNARRLAGAAVLAIALAGGAPQGAAGVQDPISPHGTLPQRLDCVACHTGDAWSPARDPMEFDHDRETKFSLEGRHGDVGCGSCHLSLRFDEPSGIGAECSSCHIDVHSGALGSDCASCHTSESFVSAPGPDQHALTAFPLTGAHDQISCEGCHTSEQGGLYAGADTECVSCHISDYEGAEFVDHVGGGFPTECLECHTTQAWRLAPLFDHETAANGFPLLGAHEMIGCEGCHIRPGNELRFSPDGESDCVACHQPDYDREHGGSSIPTECLQCHTRNNWDAGDFDHAITGFPLVGVHVDMGCESCHGPGNELRFPRPTSSDDCVACHRADYDDEHAGSNFPTTCLECHTTSSWDADSFDHSLTGFALVGSHLAVGCESCHNPSDNSLLFQPPGSQDDCVSCHLTDYNTEHQGSSFPTTCLDCHGTDTFTGAVFDHDGLYFPITTGAHKVAVCQDCHTLPTNPATFSCLTCHEHRQSETDKEHQGEPGYVYQSSFCYSCHPDGKN